MNTPTFLVTGGLGCIGAWTLAHLVEAGQRAVCFDLGEARHRLDLLLPAEAQRAITFVRGDLTELAQLQAAIRQHGVTHIIHLAALQVPFCRANPVLGAQVNVVGTVNLFEAARQAGIGHLAFASSIAVYGDAALYPPGPLAHDAPPAPQTLYGVYKVANEGTARLYARDYGVSSVGLRPYTVYGVGRDQGLTSDPTKAMRAAARGEPFEIGFGGRMQLQWASDVARQFIDAAQAPAGGAAVYNLGTPPVTIAEVVDLIRAVRPDARISVREEVRLPFPEAFDDAALRAAAPRVYETPLADGIRQTMAHFARQVAQA